MPRIAAHIKTIENLEVNGWEFHHTALVSRYRYAGTVSAMQSRKGYEFCRVHHGECIGRRRTYQKTTVMARRSE